MPRLRKYQMNKSLLKLLRPCARGPCIVILLESGPKQCRSSMNSSQNSASLRSSISVSLSSRRRYQNPTKPQDLATMKTSEATPNKCTSLILMVAGHQRIGRRISEHLRKKDIREPSTKDPCEVVKEAEH
jgi:hypothetical protein